MVDHLKMVAAAHRAMVNVLELKAADRVLVVQDPKCWPCSEPSADAARKAGCATTTYLLPKEGRPLQTMPDGLRAAFDQHDVVINVMVGDNDEVPFRIEWLTMLEESGVRIGHSPSITEEMMDGGPMDVDYAAMWKQARALMKVLNKQSSLHITAPAGTDIKMSIEGRWFVSDVKVTEEETGCNLPCGEVYCCPVETGAEGILVADGPIGGEGVPPEPVYMTVRGGRVIDAKCESSQWQERITELLDTDEGARTIAELGIGLNPKARLVGIMLEDEKALRTAHIAFGSNVGMPGGKSDSKTHIDYLFHKPTIVAYAADGSSQTVTRDGDLLV